MISLNDGKTIDLEFKESIDPLVVRAILENWFKNMAQQKLRTKFMEALVRYRDFGFKPTGFTVRTMKKRWGSCSSKGKIAISYDLIRLDEIYGDYVIAHELCHLKQHNHSQNYYKLLSEVYPGWKEIRGGLREYLR
jgi:predicted metal-dependent hydrolase